MGEPTIKREINPSVPTGTDDVQRALESVLARGVSWGAICKRLSKDQREALAWVIVDGYTIGKAGLIMSKKADRVRDLVYSCEDVLKRM